MTIKKVGSFSKLIQDLTDHRLTSSAVFDPDATGSVPIDHIWVMILMNALPDSEFMFMKESMYAKDLKVAFPQFAVVLQEMQNYDLNKKKATPKQEAHCTRRIDHPVRTTSQVVRNMLQDVQHHYEKTRRR